MGCPMRATSWLRERRARRDDWSAHAIRWAFQSNVAGSPTGCWEELSVSLLTTWAFAFPGPRFEVPEGYFTRTLEPLGDGPFFYRFLAREGVVTAESMRCFHTT